MQDKCTVIRVKQWQSVQVSLPVLHWLMLSFCGDSVYCLKYVEKNGTCSIKTTMCFCGMRLLCLKIGREHSVCRAVPSLARGLRGQERDGFPCSRYFLVSLQGVSSAGGQGTLGLCVEIKATRNR